MQAGGVQESRQLYLPDLYAGSAAGLDNRHRAVTANRHAGGVSRQSDGRLHRETAGRYQLAVLVGLEGAVPGESGCAVGHQHLKKTVAADHYIFGIVSFCRIALGMNPLGRHDAHTGAELQT